MKPKNHKSEPSQRQLRVGELVRHILANAILQYDFSRHPLLDGVHISVSEVRLSADLTNATVFVNSLQGVPNARQLAELNGLAGMFRKSLAQELTMKSVPRLHFTEDNAAITAERIDNLLDSPDVKKDLIGRDLKKQQEDA